MRQNGDQVCKMPKVHQGASPRLTPFCVLLRLGSSEFLMSNAFPHRIEGSIGLSEAAGFFRPAIDYNPQSDESSDGIDVSFQKNTEAIVIRNAEGAVILWSAGAEKLYGVSASDILGRPWPSGFSRKKDQLLDAERVTHQQGEWAGKLTQSSADGAEIEVQSRWVLLPSQRGEAPNILIINTLEFDSRHLEEERLRAQRQECIGVLASGIAHDLNNTLQPTAMAMDLIRGRLHDPESQDLLQVVDANLRRATEFVRQILSFTLGGASGIAKVSLGEIIADIASFAKHAFPNDIQIQTDIPAGLSPVLANATQLKQVLLNLCVNARDAMPEGGVLSLTACNVDLDQDAAKRNPIVKAGRFVRISVSDTGSGIPQSVRDKIFEPFFTTKGPEKGTGLGLATVMGIVRGHGGFLLLESAEGRGTAFQIFIPAASSLSAAPMELSSIATTELRGHGETILLVEDEPTVLKLMQRSLERAGYHVMTASDGQKGLDCFTENQEKITLVLTDMSMPGMGGAEMIRQLRKESPFVKVICTSGIAYTNGHMDSLGLDKILAKPCDSKTMLEAIRDVLKAEPLSGE
jgi:PAS domain S-box-containing protein